MGNGIAALSAIKALREAGFTSPVTLISAESCNAYSPVLTIYYISGKLSKDELFIADERFYRRYKVKTILGNRAAGIDTPGQVVYLESGLKVGYDNLLIATGASPKRPGNINTDSSDRVLTLRTIEEAKRIKELSETANEVIFLGAGLVSLQIANAIYRKGAKFTFVVSSNQVLSRNIDVDCAAMVQKEIESRSISVLLGRGINGIGREGNEVVVTLDSGEELRAGIVIVGKGMSPNIELTKGSGINVNKGILVDESMRTSIENIFAAGDVAESRDSVTGESNIVQTWPNACEQGRIAGLNMVDYQRRAGGALKANITRVFGLTLATVGLSKSLNGKFEEFKYLDPSGRIYRKILLKDDKLAGAVLLNRVEDIGLIRNLIKTGISISSLKEKGVKTPLDLAMVIRLIINHR